MTKQIGIFEQEENRAKVNNRKIARGVLTRRYSRDENDNRLPGAS